MNWISVKDRLPDTEVLAYSSKHKEYLIGYIGSVDSYGLCVESESQMMDEVTHWMLLPEPPKQQ